METHQLDVIVRELRALGGKLDRLTAAVERTSSANDLNHNSLRGVLAEISLATKIMADSVDSDEATPPNDPPSS